MIANIKTIDDVKAFMHKLVDESVSVHPDELFENYVNLETGDNTYTPEQAEFRNRLMKKCFEVCENEGKDIYDVVQEICLSRTGLDKYIPLPSSLK